MTRPGSVATFRASHGVWRCMALLQRSRRFAIGFWVGRWIKTSSRRWTCGHATSAASPLTRSAHCKSFRLFGQVWGAYLHRRSDVPAPLLHQERQKLCSPRLAHALKPRATLLEVRGTAERSVSPVRAPQWADQRWTSRSSAFVLSSDHLGLPRPEENACGMHGCLA